MAKVLVTAHMGRVLLRFGNYNYKVLLSMGHEVHVAANFKDNEDDFIDMQVVKHQIDFGRNPFIIKNILLKKQLDKLLQENDFDLIHTETPLCSVISRLSAKKFRKKGVKVLYTAHGFHFYHGAPFINWLIYYPVEKWMSRYTDCIITVNSEDYYAAKNKLHMGKVEYIPGVGIDLAKFHPYTEEEKIQLRNEYGIKNNSFVLVFVAELGKEKQQDFLIKAIGILRKKLPTIKLMLVGTGKKEASFKKLVQELDLANYIDFFGYRKDIVQLLAISDVAVSASKREGLPINVLEAMAMGLPLAVTNCRGNRDLVTDGENGFVVGTDDVSAFVEAIEKLYKDRSLIKEFGKNNVQKAKEHSIDKVQRLMLNIYSSYIKNNLG